MVRILVADDNANIQKMVALAFEERGIDVVSVGNGEAAVRRLPDLNPDLVLADVFMPVRNGYEVCEFVKKDTRFSHVPVILLVGAFDPLDEKEARRVGADGVLKKPFVPPDPLIAMVTSALEKNPKLAAELAKAKEVVIEPPPPAALEIPAKADPKPLPEFPEPTPEEAAAIYGFGKGVRSLDDEAPGAKEPEAPAGDAETAEEEEFDSAATANDWRRTTAMDFEVSEEASKRPAFSTDNADKDFAPITFPSERDVPPRRIRPGEIEEKAPQHAASAFPSAPEPSPVVEETKSKTENAPAHQWEAPPEPSPKPRVHEWMDMMAPPPSEYPEGGWATNAAPAQAESSALQTPAAPPPSQDETEAAPAASHFDEETPFIAEDKSKKKSWFEDAVEAVREVVHGVAHDASQEVAPEPAPQTPVASASADSQPELLVAPADAPRFSRKDPELEEPPVVQVIPEPMLVNDEPSEPSQYVKRHEETPPAHLFLPPPQHAPVFEPPVAKNVSAQSEASSEESDSAEYSERIPTAPPPNREALADIPFLTPPPAAVESPKADAGTVDAVVQKLLERLEPQLHDLLSQGVLKPLVENLIQNELSKKNK